MHSLHYHSLSLRSSVSLKINPQVFQMSHKDRQRLFIVHQYDIDITNLSVCPSVRYVLVPDENGLKYRHSFFHHMIAKSFCFYQHPTSSRNSDWVTPCAGAKYRWVIKISRFSTNKSLYLANDAKFRDSYYGRRTVTDMWSIKWCHFQ